MSVGFLRAKVKCIVSMLTMRAEHLLRAFLPTRLSTSLENQIHLRYVRRTKWLLTLFQHVPGKSAEVRATLEKGPWPNRPGHDDTLNCDTLNCDTPSSDKPSSDKLV